MFNKRYHRSGELIDILNAQIDIEVEMQDAAFDHGLVDDIMEEEVDTLVLSDRQKYNKVMPVLLRLGNLVSVHGTKVFLDYMDEIEIAEQRVRRGQKIFSKYQRLEMENTDDVNQATEQGNKENVEEQHMEDQQTVEIESGENIDGGNRFKSLKMKEKVKTKGRPKGKSKQLTFNKTAHDRREKTAKPKGTKNKKTKPDFIDDDNGSASEKSEHSVVLTRKKVKTRATVNEANDEESDLESFHLESDGDSFNEEECFYSTTTRPICFICNQAIEEFVELSKCEECRKNCHSACCGRVCDSCIFG